MVGGGEGVDAAKAVAIVSKRAGRQPGSSSGGVPFLPVQISLDFNCECNCWSR